MLHFIETSNVYMQLLSNLLLPVLLPFVLSMLIGPKLIAVLRAMKAGQPIREARKGVLAPEHQGKVGTPTMGGLMIIGLILLSILLFADLTDARIHCILLVTCVTAFLGFTDDYAKITKKKHGWRERVVQNRPSIRGSLIVRVLFILLCAGCFSALHPLLRHGGYRLLLHTAGTAGHHRQLQCR